MQNKPSFFKHWGFYLFGKKISNSETQEQLVGENHPLVGGLSGVIGTLILIYLNKANTSWYYFAGAILWIGITCILSYLIIKPVKETNLDKNLK